MRSNKKTPNPLSANPIKWSNTLKQFVGADELFECLTISWDWRLKGVKENRPSLRCRCMFAISKTENIAEFQTQERGNVG